MRLCLCEFLFRSWVDWSWDGNSYVLILVNAVKCLMNELKLSSMASNTDTLHGNE